MKILLAVLFLFMVSSSAVADDTREDGHWWNEMSSLGRSAFVHGYVRGERGGIGFAAANKDEAVCMGKATDSWQKINAAGTTVGQLVTGLDTLYRDFRNQNILFDVALWLV